MKKIVISSVCMWAGIASFALAGQAPRANPQTAGERPVAPDRQTQTPSSHDARSTAPVGGDYRVGAGDLLAVSVLQLPDLKSEVRVSQQGAISLPLLGAVTVAGLSTAEIEQRIADALRRTYVRDPQVSVQVTAIESHPVSVVGAVAEPGVYQIRGPMNLLAVLSLAKGVTEAAGNRVLVVRGDAGTDMTEIDLKQLLESDDPRLNVLVNPGDVVKVTGAPIVYVVGEVKKPGAFPMPRGDRLTVLRAVALGEGLTTVADKNDTVILRTAADGTQSEIPIRLDRIIKADEPDPVLQPNDVLFVPGSGGRAAAQATLNALGRLISLRPF